MRDTIVSEIERIYNETVKNGGGTFDADFSPLQSGYAVASQKGSFAVVSADSPASFAEAIVSLRATYPHQAFGTWVYEGLIHIDPVHIFENRANAEWNARDLKQLAFYDLNSHQEIAV